MKKYFIGMIAIVLGITAAAFTNHKKNNRPDPYPYYFSFQGNSAMEELDSTNYLLIPVPVECEESGDLHCVINANKNGSNYPILTSGGAPAFEEIFTKAEQ